MAERLIAWDSETTGLSHKQGNRIMEVGAVEIIDGKLTGKHFDYYIKGDRKVEKSAFNVHGISDDYVAEHGKEFSEIVDEWLEFVDGATFVIHNAKFDLGFINKELWLVGKPPLKNKVIDTLQVARKLHKKQKNNLDALAERYGIDTSKREKHGALLDSEILADVYLAMCENGKKDKTILTTIAENKDMAELEDDFGLLEEGAELEGRLVYFASCGVQAPHPKYPDNPPREQVALAIEIIGKTRVFNNEVLPKLIWLSPYNKFDSLTERGKELPLYKVFDSKAKEGDVPDWKAQLGKPCSVLISHHVSGDNTYDNIESITAIPAKYQKGIDKATTEVCYSTDCDEDNAAQAGLFGLTRWLWDKRLATDKNQEAPAVKEVVKEVELEEESVPF